MLMVLLFKPFYGECFNMGYAGHDSMLLIFLSLLVNSAETKE